MKNALNYYYNFNPTSIHQVNKSYRCYSGNDEFLLTTYDKTAEELNEIYKLNIFLLQNKVPCHQIVLNNQKQIITYINNLPYVLLKISIQNRTISMDDILFFSTLNIDASNFKHLKKNDWYEMWTKKIDYFEYQISQFGKKYSIIRESANYYIGLSETAISFFQTFYQKTAQKLVVSHRRIRKNDSTLEFYNPLNFILDSPARDFSEYIKAKIFYGSYSIEQFNYDLQRLVFFDVEYKLMFSRLLFPTYYFDCYERIVFNDGDERELWKIVNQSNKYLEMLSGIYGIIKQKVAIAEIEWLIKK